MSEDGFGIAAGFDDAPTHIEIFTEPQCSHCADLQTDFGDQFAYYIARRRAANHLPAVDVPGHDSDGHSAHVSNALFLAAEGDATGTQFQRFVEELWATSRIRAGPAPPTTRWPTMAKKAGMPENVADRIAGGESAVNITDMEDTNFEYLYEIDPLDTGTPTVYDPENDEKIDIFDNDWLTKLMQS